MDTSACLRPIQPTCQSKNELQARNRLQPENPPLRELTCRGHIACSSSYRTPSAGTERRGNPYHILWAAVRPGRAPKTDDPAAGYVLTPTAPEPKTNGKVPGPVQVDLTSLLTCGSHVNTLWLWLAGVRLTCPCPSIVGNHGVIHAGVRESEDNGSTGGSAFLSPLFHRVGELTDEQRT